MNEKLVFLIGTIVFGFSAGVAFMQGVQIWMRNGSFSLPAGLTPVFLLVAVVFGLRLYG